MFVLALPLTAAMSSTATARAALLNAISPLERGFKADKQQRLVVESAIKALAASTSLRALPDISGDWELIYTDAPDILGLDAQAGPLATCTRIGTISNVIEYGPREWAANLIGQAKGDLLQQRVVTSFERRADAPTKVDLKIKGAAFVPKQLLGISLASVPALKLQGFVEPPFGSFECLYCEGPDGPATRDPDLVALDPDAGDEMEQTCEIDGLAGFGACSSIRVVRTQQGYYSINRRMTPMEGWGDA